MLVDPATRTDAIGAALIEDLLQWPGSPSARDTAAVEPEAIRSFDPDFDHTFDLQLAGKTRENGTEPTLVSERQNALIARCDLVDAKLRRRAIPGDEGQRAGVRLGLGLCNKGVHTDPSVGGLVPLAVGRLDVQSGHSLHLVVGPADLVLYSTCDL